MEAEHLGLGQGEGQPVGSLGVGGQDAGLPSAEGVFSWYRGTANATDCSVTMKQIFIYMSFVFKTKIVKYKGSGNERNQHIWKESVLEPSSQNPSNVGACGVRSGSPAGKLADSRF